MKDKSIQELIGTDFFYTLTLFEDTYDLVNFVETRSKGQWGICSSPLRGDRDNSAYHKRKWLEDNDLMPPAIENLIFTRNKEQYAITPIDGSPNILVDDNSLFQKVYLFLFHFLPNIYPLLLLIPCILSKIKE